MLLRLSTLFDCYCDTSPSLWVHEIVILIYILGFMRQISQALSGT